MMDGSPVGVELAVFNKIHSPNAYPSVGGVNSNNKKLLC